MIARKLEILKDDCRKTCLACGRDPETVHLVAVSKTQKEALIREAYGAGQHVFGENYVQEITGKAENLGDLPLCWHFIGHLQRNKARFVVRHCDLIHSVDSLRLARELDKQAENIGKVQNILIQIHLGGEDSKSGIIPEDLPIFIKELVHLPHLSIQGLMTIPPQIEEPDENRKYFRYLKELLGKVNQQNLLPSPMDILSMGMSDDFKVAIEEGATLIRIGTAIFGARE